LATTVTVTTAAAVIGADIIIIGTDQRLRRGGCISRHTNGKPSAPLRFDFRKSRFLQLLIQRGKIGLL
jgi:hypothetical protein